MEALKPAPAALALSIHSARTSATTRATRIMHAAPGGLVAGRREDRWGDETRNQPSSINSPPNIPHLSFYSRRQFSPNTCGLTEGWTPLLQPRLAHLVIGPPMP